MIPWINGRVVVPEVFGNVRDGSGDSYFGNGYGCGCSYNCGSRYGNFTSYSLGPSHNGYDDGSGGDVNTRKNNGRNPSLGIGDIVGWECKL